MKPPCPDCHRIGHSTHAVGLFNPDGPTGYRADYPDAPLHRTREAAQADMCAWRQTHTGGAA